MSPADEPEVGLQWKRFTRMTEARAAFRATPCLYIQSDSEGRVLRIGAATKGLDRRYWGGTGYALDAAMHDSGNLVFVAAVGDQQTLLAVERQLIYDERPAYNNQGAGPSSSPPSRRFRVLNEGQAPSFGGNR